MKKGSENYSALSETGAVLEKRSTWQRFVLDLKKSPISARFGLIVIAIYIFIAVFAPWLAPYGESQVFPAPYEPWSKEFIFGTDQIGRDILSRMIYGARNTVGIAVATTALAFFIGGVLGLAAAIAKGWLDQLLSRLVDALMAIPSLIFALVLLSIFGTNIINLIIIIAILVVILFGKGKISSIMGDLAKGIKSFKKGMSDENSSEKNDPNNNSDNPNSENK